VPKPKISDAEGWIRICEDNFDLVEIYVPSGVIDSAPAGALRNWYKVSVDGRRDKYFYGETAYQDAMREARDAQREIERERYGW